MTAPTRDSGSSEQGPEPSREGVGIASADAVAVRAHELFEERGRQPGRDLDDWLRAEHELQDGRGQSER